MEPLEINFIYILFLIFNNFSYIIYMEEQKILSLYMYILNVLMKKLLSFVIFIFYFVKIE